MGRRDILLAGAMLASTAIAACSGNFVQVSPGASPGNVARGNACSLVTIEELKGILNTDEPLAAFQDPADPATCSFGPPGGQGSAGANVTWQASGGQQTIKAFADSSSYVPVAGIGDEAYQNDGELVFRIGDQFFHVRLGAGGPGPDEAVLMAKVVALRATGQPVPAGLIPTPPPVLSSKDPCKLVSNEEAATALGTAPLSSYNNDTGAPNQPIFCYYSLADGTAILSTFLDPRGGFDSFDATIADWQTTPVDGLGDKAAFEAYSGKLLVLKGDTIFMVNAYTGEPETMLEADRKIMEIILSHI